MAAQYLVIEKLNKGKKVLDAVRAARIDCEMVAWRFEEERDAWRLYIVAPLAEAGPIQAYKKLNPILKQLFDDNFSPFEYEVVAPQESLAKQLREAVDAASFSAEFVTGSHRGVRFSAWLPGPPKETKSPSRPAVARRARAESRAS